jgi:hypothetical protein
MHDVPQRYQEPDDQEPRAAPSFPGMSMRDFMSLTSAYGHIPAPFSPLLRHTTRVGMLLTLITAFVIALLPAIEGEIKMVTFPYLLQGLNDRLDGYLYWLAHSPWVSYSDALLLSAGLVLLIFTRNLQRGTAPQHWLAFAIALGGTINLLLLLVAFLMFLPNIIAWLLLILGILVIIIVSLGVLAA